MPPEVDFCPVELPGRSARLDEPPFTSMSALMERLDHALQPLMGVPFGFFGHSVGACMVASTPLSPAPSAAAKVPNNLYFPSAKSIPPVNIMTAEPPPAQRQPQDTTGAAEAATPTPPRRPPQAGAQPRPPASAAPARSAPTPLAPAQ